VESSPLRKLGLILSLGFSVLSGGGTLLAAGQAPSARGAARLAAERSPYLIAHADNLVDWYPWGEEAFSKARREQKPIFLSIGFATCHWCEVMEEECFKDPKVAAYLNRHFVSIKVDREERPDVDQVYTSFLKAATGKTGWPLTAFLTPELKPFFGAGFYRRDALFNQLKKIAVAWEKDPAAVRASAGKVESLLDQMYRLEASDSGPGTPPHRELLEPAYQALLPAFDRKNGGFGRSPKFFPVDELQLLSRSRYRTGSLGSLQMITATLDAVARGGIRDQLGGGIHRFTGDDAWHFPQFEKMLPLQASEATAFIEGFQLTGNVDYLGIATETLDFVLSELRSPEGFFYSSLGAAGPCPEGTDEDLCSSAYYGWTRTDFDRAAGEDADIMRARLGIDSGAGKSGPTSDPVFILYQARSEAELAAQFGIGADEVRFRLERGRRRLLEARKARLSPPLDDKATASWNGIMISALCRAAEAGAPSRFLDAAIDGAEAFLARLYNPQSGELQRIFHQGRAGTEAALEDYVFLIRACLDLYDATLDDRWASTAIRLQEEQLKRFLDEKGGGFFNSAANGPGHWLRLKEIFDGFEPSPNAAAVTNLARLSQISGRPEWMEIARRTAQAFESRLQRQLGALALRSADGYLGEKPLQIVLAGDRSDARTLALLREVHRRFLPYRVLLCADGGELHRQTSERLDFLKAMRPIGGVPTAYVCRDYICRMPTADPRQLGTILDEEPRSDRSVRSD